MAFSVPKEIKDIFVRAKNGEFCLLKLVFENGQFKLDASRESVSSWDQDYDSCLFPLLKENQSALIFYRLGNVNTQGVQWLLIQWQPVYSPIMCEDFLMFLQLQEKILCATVVRTLKEEFGAINIKDELFGTAWEHVSLSAYYEYISH